MLLNERMSAQGGALFRRRGYLPYLLLPLFAVAVVQAGADIQHGWGKAAEEALETVSVLIAVAGALLRIATVGFVPAGTSGRNTHGQRASVLNTSGLYSVVRNPLYLGNYLVLLGFCLGTQVWWFALAVTLAFALYYERIIAAEEAFLSEKFGEEYVAWARRTPAFIPNPALWRRPDLPFSWRTVVRREYNGVFLVVLMVVVLEVVHDVIAGDADWSHWPADWAAYFAVLGVSALAYLTVRWIKHNTGWLRVAGRS